MSSHFARATESEMRTFRKSGGTLCTAPGEIAFLPINFILLRYAVRDQKLEIHMDDYGVNQALGARFHFGLRFLARSCRNSGSTQTLLSLLG